MRVVAYLKICDQVIIPLAIPIKKGHLLKALNTVLPVNKNALILAVVGQILIMMVKIQDKRC